jgi:hypothetical protein
MTSIKGYDIGSARLMLAHLGRAAKHYQERDFARKKLKIQLSRLKKIDTKSMRRYVQELEQSIGEAIRKEQRILKHQQQEDVFHGDVASRINELEARLARYLTIHEARAQRVKLLESALSEEDQAKRQQIALIKKSLNRAERIFSRAKKEKRHPKRQIAAVRKALDSIKAKVDQIGKKL